MPSIRKSTALGESHSNVPSASRVRGSHNNFRELLSLTVAEM